MTFLGRWLDRESMRSTDSISGFFPGLLLHSGFLHLAVNCMAMYWACQVLMPILGSGKLLLFALAAGCGAQAAFLLLLAPDAAILWAALL